MRTRNPILRILIHLSLIIWAIYSTFPFFWAFLGSIKKPVDANARVPVIFGFTPTAQNYVELWLNMPPEEFVPIGIGIIVIILALVAFAVFTKDSLTGPIKSLVIISVLVVTFALLPQIADMAKFYTYFLNSVIITVCTLLISISIGCLAGYGIARYSGLLGVIILVAALGFRALPRMAFVLPYYYLAHMTGLYDTHIMLILALVAVNQPFTVWMLRSFFMEIPREIEEAAMIDGAGRLQSFLRVIVPITWPGIITTSLFTLLLAYNEFLLARVLMQTNLTLPVAIAQFTSGEDAGHITIANAAAVSIALPIVFVIIFFQKHLIKGLASGAVKG